MVNFPITLGAKNTRIDWTNFDNHCQSLLGFIPVPGQKLTPMQWEKLGYLEAGKSKPYDWRQR